MLQEILFDNLIENIGLKLKNVKIHLETCNFDRIAINKMNQIMQ